MLHILPASDVARLSAPSLKSQFDPLPALASDLKASIDSDLITAAADLDRLDAEIAALAARNPGVDLHEVRGFRIREAARDKALRTLCRIPARTAAGLAAKARALRTRNLIGDTERHGALAVSLAADTERLAAEAAPAPQPAPEHRLPEMLDASADAALLALIPELEAAAAPYLAYDRVHDMEVSDPEHDAAMAHSGALYRPVQAVADRILNHRPTTLAGVLLTAHAAALMVEGIWDVAPDGLSREDRPLRAVCDGLFRLAGVDWRGRPLTDGTARAGLDAPALTPVRDPVHAAIAASRSARAAKEVAAAMPTVETPAGERQLTAAIDAEDEAWNRLLATPPTTIAGAQALARFASDYIRDRIWDYTDDASVLFRAIGAVGVGHVATAPASGHIPSTDAALIPLAEAAIAEQRAAAAVSLATDYDAPPGTYDRALDLLVRVAATDARTLAGLTAKARLLLTHIPEGDDFDGDERSEALALSIARDTLRLGGAIVRHAPAATRLPVAAE